jgi:hypothetical protein
MKRAPVTAVLTGRPSMLRPEMKSPTAVSGANSGHHAPEPQHPESATNGLVHTSKSRCYSIISSARASSAGGRVRPSPLAVFRLIRSWNLVA